MIVLYAVAGEGMGHATRSRPIIAHLRKRHDVKVFAGGKALQYLHRFFPVSWIASSHIIYRNNRVSDSLTLLFNLIRAPLYAVSFFKMIAIMLFRRPDLLITDFEGWSAWAALLTGVPIISIDNENVITNASLQLPKRYFSDFAKAWAVTKCTIPFAHAAIIPSFFFPPLKSRRAHYINPVIRQEIAARRPTQGQDVLVYQTSSTNQQLLTVLKRLPQQQFIVYGFPKKGREGNMLFKRFNEQEFFDDIASSRAIIANGGFSLLSEALFLRKPVLSIPITGQCEQIINAHYLEKLGYGMMAHQASANVLRQFFARVPRLREALKAIPRWNSSRELRKIEGVLQRATA